MADRPEAIESRQPCSDEIVACTDSFYSNLNQPNFGLCSHALHHPTHRYFDQSVCDGCFLESLGEPIRYRPTIIRDKGTHVYDDKLIIESQVTIEIEMSSSHDQEQLNQNSMIEEQDQHSVTTSIERCSDCSADSSPHVQPRTTTKRQTWRKDHRNIFEDLNADHDADDEGSDCRSRKPFIPHENFTQYSRIRSRVKEPPRQGIDISRNDLRMSSRLSTAGLSNTNYIQAALGAKAKTNDGKSKNVFERWTVKDGTSYWAKVKTMRQMMKSLNDGSKPQKLRKKAKYRSKPHSVGENTRVTTNIQLHGDHDKALKPSGLTTLRMISDKDSDKNPHSRHVHSIDDNQADVNRVTHGCGTGPNIDLSPEEAHPLTWSEHLEHDLADRTRRRRRPDIQMLASSNTMRNSRYRIQTPPTSPSSSSRTDSKHVQRHADERFVITESDNMSSIVTSNGRDPRPHFGSRAIPVLRPQASFPSTTQLMLRQARGLFFPVYMAKD